MLQASKSTQPSQEWSRRSLGLDPAISEHVRADEAPRTVDDDVLALVRTMTKKGGS
jgi:hypothetical protein